MILTHEHKELYRTVKKFVEEEINPHVPEWEEAGIWPAHEIIKKMGDLGLLGISRRPTRREWRRAITVFVVAIAALLLAIAFVHPKPQLLPVGSTAPAIHLRDPSGTALTAVPSAAHHAVVLMFIEPSCPTCREKAPLLCTLRSSHPAVDVVMVDAGSNDARAATDFARRYLSGCGVRVLLDASLAVSRSYAVSVVPLTYVVDERGKISYSGYGAAGMDGLLPHLAHVPGG